MTAQTEQMKAMVGELVGLIGGSKIRNGSRDEKSRPEALVKDPPSRHSKPDTPSQNRGISATNAIPLEVPDLENF